MDPIIALFGFQLKSGHRSEIFGALTFAFNEILQSTKKRLDSLDEKKKAIIKVLSMFYRVYPFKIETNIFPEMKLPRPSPECGDDHSDHDVHSAHPADPEFMFIRCTTVLIHIRDCKNLVYVYEGKKPGMGYVTTLMMPKMCDRPEDHGIPACGDSCFMSKVEAGSISTKDYRYVVTAFWCDKRYIFHFGIKLDCACRESVPCKPCESSSSSSCEKKKCDPCSSSSSSSSSCEKKCKPKKKYKPCKDNFCGPRMLKPYVVFNCAETVTGSSGHNQVIDNEFPLLDEQNDV